MKAGETLGVIIVVNYDVAEELRLLGYNYSKIHTSNCILYQFIESESLRKELLSKYDNGSFFVSKNICY